MIGKAKLNKEEIINPPFLPDKICFLYFIDFDLIIILSKYDVYFFMDLIKAFLQDILLFRKFMNTSIIEFISFLFAIFFMILFLLDLLRVFKYERKAMFFSHKLLFFFFHCYQKFDFPSTIHYTAEASLNM